MQSKATFSQIPESNSQKSKSVAKSMMQSLRTHAYSAKTFRKLTKSMSAKSRKAHATMSQMKQNDEPEQVNQARSWDDGVIGAWATNGSNLPENAGDVFGDNVMSDKPIEWDTQGYPSSGAPKNMNAMVETWGTEG